MSRAESLLDEQNAEGVLATLLSADDDERREMLGELGWIVKGRSSTKVDFLAPILVRALAHDDTEVAATAAGLLARLVHDSWEHYAEHCIEAQVRNLLVRSLDRKHQGIRGGVARTMLAHALREGDLELARAPFTHAATKVRRAAASGLQACVDGRLSLAPITADLVGFLVGADKKVARGILAALASWVSDSAPTPEHVAAVEALRDQLVASSVAAAAVLEACESFLASAPKTSELDEHIEALRTGFFSMERTTAIDAIEELFTKGGVDFDPARDAITIALTDEEEDVRRRAGRTLTTMAVAAGRVPHTLRHPDPLVREQAADAMGFLLYGKPGPDGAREVLEELEHDPVQAVRMMAAESLARLREYEEMMAPFRATPSVSETSATTAPPETAEPTPELSPPPSPPGPTILRTIAEAASEVGSLLSKFDRMGESDEDWERVGVLQATVRSAAGQLPEVYGSMHAVLRRWRSSESVSLTSDWYELERVATELIADDQDMPYLPPAPEPPVQQAPTPPPEPPLPAVAGVKLVFTGKFSTGTRDELADFARAALAIVQRSVGKTTDYLVVGARPGKSALAKAEEHGVSVVSEQQLRDGIDNALGSMESYVADLRAACWDISYYSNEADGLVGTFRDRFGKVRNTRTALVRYARKSAAVKKYISSSIESARSAHPSYKLLAPKKPERGWLGDERDYLIARRTSLQRWNERKQEYDTVSGHQLFELLSLRLDDLDAISVHSSQEHDSVVALHFIGGRDRTTGELAGIVLQRVWT